MENSTAPTQSQIDLVLSDWLGTQRDSRTAVHKGMAGIGAPDGDNLSTYFLGDDRALKDRSQIRLLTKARSIAQTAVNSVSREPVRVFLGRSDSYTDGRTVTVATDFFDLDIPSSDKTDYIVGYAIHEACHLNHTDFLSKAAWLNRMPWHRMRLCADIANILEDERIEYMLSEPTAAGGDGKPGYTGYLAKVKEFSFSSYRPPEEKTCKENPVANFINLLALAVRYPKMLTRRQVEDNYALLEKARRLLIPFPRTNGEVMEATERIYALIESLVEEKLREQQQQQQCPQQSAQPEGQPQGSGTGEASDTGGTGEANYSKEFLEGWNQALEDYRNGMITI